MSEAAIARRNVRVTDCRHRTRELNLADCQLIC
jgi:hypothetical protein